RRHGVLQHPRPEGRSGREGGGCRALVIGRRELVVQLRPVLHAEQLSDIADGRGTFPSRPSVGEMLGAAAGQVGGRYPYQGPEDSTWILHRQEKLGSTGFTKNISKRYAATPGGASLRTPTTSSRKRSSLRGGVSMIFQRTRGHGSSASRGTS